MLIYSVGLDGPYLFDDTFNLMPVRLWAAGRLDWSEVMFGNVSGILGRPVSMASFMLSAAIGGATPLDYKVGNLAIHLVCSVVIFRLLQRLMAANHRSPDTVTVSAGLLTALWLLHPLHVSTVLYAVQRMAQLSTLFVLLALLA
ncbi:tetratricopeptide repeat protein, partial [Lysobacter sp. 2RAB21]